MATNRAIKTSDDGAFSSRRERYATDAAEGDGLIIAKGTSGRTNYSENAFKEYRSGHLCALSLRSWLAGQRAGQPAARLAVQLCRAASCLAARV